MNNQPFISERLVQYPIHYAAFNGELKKVRFLLLKNPDLLNSRDYSQSTPLIVAVHAGKKSVAQYLLAKGAEINIQNATGATAAIEAAQLNKSDLLDMIRKYSKNKKNISQKSEDPGSAEEQDEWMKEERLHNAILLNDLKTIDEFLEKDPKRLDSGINKRNLLMTAVLSDDKELIEFLVKKGANINIRESGWTPLHQAAEKNKINAVKTLLDLHADIKCKAGQGYTPLHLAAKQGNKEIVYLLIKSGADVNAHNNYGDTPLSDAIKNNHKEVIILIRNAGAQEK